MAITWLANRLRADGGLKVVEHSGWRTRARPGSFNPGGVLLHHTGATASNANPAPSLRTVINGRSDLPGPLCHVLVDYKGVCHVIAAGRANHAGQAKASGPVPGGDGNALYVGIEIDYSGYQNPSNVQYANVVNVAAAVLSKFGKSARWSRCHLETSVTGKWDPGHTWTPDQWRSMVKAWMAHRWGSASRASLDFPSGLPVELESLRRDILAHGPAFLETSKTAPEVAARADAR